MSKIKKITVSNLKAVSKLTADFNGCTAIITGGNNKGKSSFLKSLPERLRGRKPEVILKKGEKEGFAEWELTTGEKFVWQFDGKKEKLVFISDRNIKQSVTKELSKVYFPPVFDVDEFLQAAPAKQKKVLQELTGIDFTEIDRAYQAAYEERTFANRKLAEEKAKFIKVDPDLPAEEIPIIELEKELAGIDLHNERYKSFKFRVSEKETQLLTNEAEIIRMQNLIDSLKTGNEELKVQINSGNAWLNNDNNKPKDNIKELEENLKKVRQTNEEIKANNLAKLQAEELKKAEQNVLIADADVKRIEAEKLDVIRNASMPEGFGFSDNGITYQGFDFNKEQLSSSGIYIAALKLAALTLGEVKSIHFDASFLDKNSLQEIESWANENDLQLLIERPDFDGGEIEYHLLNTISVQELQPALS